MWVVLVRLHVMSDNERTITFEDLPGADLIVDARYLGGTAGTMRDDPIARLLDVGNQGGFRYKGSPRQGTVKLAVLYTSRAEADWPDALDVQTGVLTYYGDNRTPGRDLHDTQRSGNLLLRDVFTAAHGTAADRQKVPPFLLFEKAAPGRAVRFRGLLAPGASTLSSDDELAAIWRSREGHRFQNYRARFTVLDVPSVPRAWLRAVLAGAPTTTSDCPPAWKNWVDSRAYSALVAPSTMVVRSRSQQLPAEETGRSILEAIHRYFSGWPQGFEECAVAVWRMIAPSTGRCDVTRPSRDGGRDAVGQYLLGPLADRVVIDFALEAKCYGPSNSVGVREVSRLISRLRHRHFGVFVTLSYFNAQVYDEVRSDGHPIALICGRDVVDALREHGYGTVDEVQAWLEKMFPGPGQ